MTSRHKIVLGWPTAKRILLSHPGKVVFTNGCFDILHPGHVHLLEQAKACGDTLVVGVNTDASVRGLGKGDNRPILPLQCREIVLAALQAVDMVVSFDEPTPERLIRFLSPEILVKGADWEDRRAEVAGADYVEQTGGKVIFLPLLEGYSTTSIIERVRACPKV